MNTRAIILAAGRGSRLRHLTDARPKGLVQLAGRPLIDWQLAALRGAGIDEVLIVRGYRAELITGDFATRDNPRWAETHMVASLLCARDWLEAGPCLVSYSDIVYPAAAAARLAASGAPLAILYDTRWADLWSRRFTDPLSDAETFRIDARRRVTEIGGRARRMADVEGQYMGLLRFTPASLASIDAVIANSDVPVDRLDMTSLLARLIGAGHDVTGVPWDGGWCEVDNEDDLAVAESLLAHRELELTAS